MYGPVRTVLWADGSLSAPSDPIPEGIGVPVLSTMSKKQILKSTIILTILLCLVATIQTAAAIYFSESTAIPAPADLVVVFPGESQRIKAAIQIAKDVLPPHFMVISTTDWRP